MFFVVYQLFENHVVQPVVMSRTVRLNPLGVLLVVIAGVELAGMLGALLALPVAGRAQGRVRGRLAAAATARRGGARHRRRRRRRPRRAGDGLMTDATTGTGPSAEPRHRAPTVRRRVASRHPAEPLDPPPRRRDHALERVDRRRRGRRRVDRRSAPWFDFPGWWATTLFAATSAATLVMVFIVQHTQARLEIATQRKLDELLRALPGADNRLIAAEVASDAELADIGEQHLEERRSVTRTTPTATLTPPVDDSAPEPRDLAAADRARRRGRAAPRPRRAAPSRGPPTRARPDRGPEDRVRDAVGRHDAGRRTSVTDARS